MGGAEDTHEKKSVIHSIIKRINIIKNPYYATSIWSIPFWSNNTVEFSTELKSMLMLIRNHKKQRERISQSHFWGDIILLGHCFPNKVHSCRGKPGWPWCRSGMWMKVQSRAYRWTHPALANGSQLMYKRWTLEKDVRKTGYP